MSCTRSLYHYMFATIDISYTLDGASHTVWAGENWSRIAGAGRSRRVDTEHDKFVYFVLRKWTKLTINPLLAAKKYLIHKWRIAFSVAFFLMSGNDQHGRRLLLWGDTAEIFGFTFWYADALSSVYEISMAVACMHRVHLILPVSCNHIHVFHNTLGILL